jgi:hypothetical protein
MGNAARAFRGDQHHFEDIFDIVETVLDGNSCH